MGRPPPSTAKKCKLSQNNKKCLEINGYARIFCEVFVRVSVKNRHFSQYFLYKKSFFFFQNYPIQAFFFYNLQFYIKNVKKTCIKLLCPLTAMGGGVKTLAGASSKNVFF